MASSASSSEGAHVRIVRLSQVIATKQDDVQVDRNTGRGFENGFENLPITEGTKLRTGAGFAEVEFEDNSSLRITPHTLIEFSQLGLLPSGATVSLVNVVEGNVYVSLENTRNTQFTLTFGREKIALMPSTHIRLHVRPASKQLAVYSGSTRLEGPPGMTIVGKKKMLTFDPTGENAPVMTKNTLQSRYDHWDRNAVQFHKVSRAQSFPYLFGVSDLNYYGAFADTGCGLMWWPYLVSAAWDPYMNGNWVWYPSAGYTWVSSYPWGWMPYHYGEWIQCGPSWGWLPGGYWAGLNNPPKPPAPKPGPQPPRPHPPLPPRPPKPVVPANATIVAVNRRPLTSSSASGPGNFVFRNDSAGTGIPRARFKNLADISNHVLRQGSFTATIPVTGLGRSAQARSNSGPQQANTARNQAASSAPSARGNPANSFGSSGAHGSATGAAQSGGSARPK
jgi:FecR protein